MKQTENTAIVLRYANYRDNDRMLTLFSPTKGRIEALARGCRKPRSPILNASELFALGDYELYERGNHLTVISAVLTETFYPLREDFDRLSVGTYLLGVVERIIQPGVPAQDTFMLLLYTLSRLTFSDQPWRPLVTGFLLHLSRCEGFAPRLRHCVRCQRTIGNEESMWFDLPEGGLVCRECHQLQHVPVSLAQVAWLREMMTKGTSKWLDTPEMQAPLRLMRQYVEMRLDQPVRGASMLPKD